MEPQSVELIFANWEKIVGLFTGIGVFLVLYDWFCGPLISVTHEHNHYHKGTEE